MASICQSAGIPHSSLKLEMKCSLSNRITFKYFLESWLYFDIFFYSIHSKLLFGDLTLSTLIYANNIIKPTIALWSFAHIFNCMLKTLLATLGVWPYICLTHKSFFYDLIIIRKNDGHQPAHF